MERSEVLTKVQEVLHLYIGMINSVQRMKLMEFII